MMDELEHTWATCYKLGDILFVPHYKRIGVFVGPGHQEFDKIPVPNRSIEYSEMELISLGATKVQESLWKR